MIHVRHSVHTATPVTYIRQPCSHLDIDMSSSSKYTCAPLVTPAYMFPSRQFTASAPQDLPRSDLHFVSRSSKLRIAVRGGEGRASRKDVQKRGSRFLWVAAYNPPSGTIRSKKKDTRIDRDRAEIKSKPWR